MAKGALAFVTGFGTGYMNQTRQDKLDAERQEDRDQVKSENAERQAERDRVKRERNELSEAGKTATVNSDAAVVDGLSTKPVLYESSDVASSDLRQDRRMREASAAPVAPVVAPSEYEAQFDKITQADTAPVAPDAVASAPVAQPSESPAAAPAPVMPALAPASPAPTARQAFSVNGKEYADVASADAAAKTFNDGRMQRISDTLMTHGRPDAALNMDAASLKMADAKRANARTLLSEGLVDVATASRNGNAQGLMDAMNKQGDYKITELPVARAVERTLPGMGKQMTYDYDVTMVGKDGKEIKKTVNSHDLTMMVFDAKEQLSFQLKANESEASQAYKAGLYEIQLKNLERRERQLDMGGNSGGVGSGAGSRGGKGGKAPMSAIEDAQSRAADAMEKPGEKIKDSVAYSRVQSNIVGIIGSNPSISPATAAAIALDAEADPSKITLQISDKDGSINSVYRNKAYDGGNPFVLSRNSGSLKDMETQLSTLGKDGKKTMQQQSAKVYASMNPETQAMFLEASRNPAVLKKMQEKISESPNTQQIPDNLNRLNNMVALFAAYNPSPAAAPADKSKPSTLATNFGVGQSQKPTYEAWMAAKNQKDSLLKNASKMSPGQRDIYLQSRLPDIESQIKRNADYLM